MAARTILVVDNQPEILTVTKAILSRSSYSVRTATNGKEALQILNVEKPVDLVLAEALLPDLSGIELIRRVKQEFPGTAVMLMTGFADRPIDSSIPLIEKPFTTTTLIDRVESVLALSRHLVDSLAQQGARASELFARTRELVRELQQARAEAFESVARSRERRQKCSLRRTGTEGLPAILVALKDRSLQDAVCRLLVEKGFPVSQARLLVTDSATQGLQVIDLDKAAAESSFPADLDELLAAIQQLGG